MADFYISKVSTRGQLVIPAEIRKELNIQDGDYILFSKKGSKFVIEKFVPPEKNEDE